MKTVHPSGLLHAALILDALACVAVALLHLAMPQPLSDMLVLPRPLLKGTGIFLLLYTLLLVAMVNSREI
jgi:hypothetical protein